MFFLSHCLWVIYSRICPWVSTLYSACFCHWPGLMTFTVTIKKEKKHYQLRLPGWAFNQLSFYYSLYAQDRLFSSSNLNMMCLLMKPSHGKPTQKYSKWAHKKCKFWLTFLAYFFPFVSISTQSREWTYFPYTTGLVIDRIVVLLEYN